MKWALTGSEAVAMGTSASELRRGLVGVPDVSEGVATICPGNKNCGGSYLHIQKML